MDTVLRRKPLSILFQMEYNDFKFSPILEQPRYGHFNVKSEFAGTYTNYL